MGIAGVVNTGISNCIDVFLFRVCSMGICWHQHCHLHNLTSVHYKYYLGLASALSACIYCAGGAGPRQIALCDYSLWFFIMFHVPTRHIRQHNFSIRNILHKYSPQLFNYWHYPYIYIQYEYSCRIFATCIHDKYSGKEYWQKIFLQKIPTKYSAPSYVWTCNAFPV